MTAGLSPHDNSILKALFDPEGSLPGAVQMNAQLPSLPHYRESNYAAIRAEEISIIRDVDGVSGGADLLTTALDNLSVLIQRHPEHASAYINRAQIIRLLIPIDSLFADGHAQASGQVFQDLGRGIDLATLSGSTRVSEHQTRVLAAGHTHRGFLLLKGAERVRKGERIVGGATGLQLATADQIEELASSDFAAGGRYGNKLAQQMSVKTNPYARMCGAIVKQAMKKEIEEASANGVDNVV